MNKEGVEYEVREHEPVYTCRKMAEFLNTDQNLIAKSMIMKKHNVGYFLAVLSGKIKIDFDRLGTLVNARSVSLAPVDEAEKLAGCSVGCVHPFENLINLVTYFDEKLLHNKYVFLNPGSHTKIVRIDTHALIRLVKPRVARFRKLGEAR